jgi:hypothetical protein
MDSRRLHEPLVRRSQLGSFKGPSSVDDAAKMREMKALPYRQCAQDWSRFYV